MPPPSPASTPLLTPQFCFNQTALRDFLRLSRATTDDSITQNLNALLTPAIRGFDPSSTATRSISPIDRQRLPASTCQAFTSSTLFPAWASRSQVLTYCAQVATAPDPDDPDLVLRQVETLRDRERVVDERLDPYSGRFSPAEARTEELARVVRNERIVEDIIRSRTWSVLKERCGIDGDWRQAVERWEKEHGAGRGR